MNDRTHVVKVSANLVDGGYVEWTAPRILLVTHDRLVYKGLRGKALIHELLTDDWGTPPLRVTLSCPADSGKPIEIVIPYS